jgi:hypothetical protein
MIWLSRCTNEDDQAFQLRQAISGVRATLTKQRRILSEWNLIPAHLDPTFRGAWEDAGQKRFLLQRDSTLSAYHSVEDAFNTIGFIDPANGHPPMYWAETGMRLRGNVSNIFLFALDNPHPGRHTAVVRIVADELPQRVSLERPFTIPDPTVEAIVERLTAPASGGTAPVDEARRQQVREELTATGINEGLRGIHASAAV